MQIMNITPCFSNLYDQSEIIYTGVISNGSIQIKVYLSQNAGIKIYN